MRIARQLMWSCLLAAVPAQAATLRVSEDYLTIQAAADAAQNGDEISVASGQYTENVQLALRVPTAGYTLRLMGRGDPAATVLIGNITVALPGGTAVQPNLAQLGNLTVRGRAGTLPTHGILIQNTPTQVTNCILEQHYSGIAQEQGAPLVIDQTLIQKNQWGVLGSSGGGAITVKRSALIRNDFPAWMNQGSYTLTLQDGIVAWNGGGIGASGSNLGQDTVLLERVTFLNNGSTHLALQSPESILRDLGGNRFSLPAPQPLTFVADPPAISIPGGTNLRWQTSGEPVHCCLNSRPSPLSCQSGMAGEWREYPDESTTYTVSCWNRLGIARAEAAVAVGPLVSETTPHLPLKDAFVSSAAPQRNFGKRRRLHVQTGPQADQRLAYLTFNIPTKPGWRIVSAVLRLHTAQAALAGVRVWSLPEGSSWEETALTYAARPPVTGMLHGQFGAAQPGQWVELEVVEFAGELRPSGRITFAIDSSNAVDTAYHSRETRHAPQLIVTMVPE